MSVHQDLSTRWRPGASPAAFQSNLPHSSACSAFLHSPLCILSTYAHVPPSELNPIVIGPTRPHIRVTGNSTGKGGVVSSIVLIYHYFSSIGDPLYNVEAGFFVRISLSTQQPQSAEACIVTLQNARSHGPSLSHCNVRHSLQCLKTTLMTGHFH